MDMPIKLSLSCPSVYLTILHCTSAPLMKRSEKRWLDNNNIIELYQGSSAKRVCQSKIQGGFRFLPWLRSCICPCARLLRRPATGVVCWPQARRSASFFANSDAAYSSPNSQAPCCCGGKRSERLVMFISKPRSQVIQFPEHVVQCFSVSHIVNMSCFCAGVVEMEGLMIMFLSRFKPWMVFGGKNRLSSWSDEVCNVLSVAPVMPLHTLLSLCSILSF